jgi:hypothetical protein
MVANLSKFGSGYNGSSRRTFCTDPIRHGGSNLFRKVGKESDLAHMRPRYSDPSVSEDKCGQRTNWFTGCKNDPIPYGMNEAMAAAIALEIFHSLELLAPSIGAFPGPNRGSGGCNGPLD